MIDSPKFADWRKTEGSVTRLAQAGGILVLGSNGRLGRALRHQWPDDARVIWQARGAGADVVWQPGTVWPGPARVDAIVALWGIVPGAGDLAQNTSLALAAQDLGALLGAERVLHCSSAAVYAPDPAPRPESAADPQNPYGHAKYAMEQALADWCAAHPTGPAACAMRIGNVAGADSVFAAIAKGGPVTMDRFADGFGPRRSYLDHATLARIIDGLLTCPDVDLPQVVNVANTGVIDMADLVAAAGRDLIWRDLGHTAHTVALDLSRLRRIVDPGPTDPVTLLADAALFQGAAA